jgi:hypothetical protein
MRGEYIWLGGNAACEIKELARKFNARADGDSGRHPALQHTSQLCAR